MVPIGVVTNTVGTAITLPNYPNSILTSPTGNMVFLGAGSGGVMFYNVSTATVTAMPFNGTVLAVSGDGSLLLVADFTANATYLYDVTDNANLATFPGTAIAGAITPDSQWSLSLIGQGLVRSGDSVPVVTTNLSYTPNFIDLLSQGSLAFITSSGSHFIDVRSTCDRSDVQMLNANSPTLVKGVPNGTGAVAVDVPQIDVITTSQPGGTCPTTASSTLTGYDLQAGSFNPRQLLVSYDSSNAWIITDQNAVLLFNLANHTPNSILLANNTVGLSGALTLDSSQLYVGANDGNVHRIVLNTLADELIIVPGLKDANSNVALPDLVADLPK